MLAALAVAALTSTPLPARSQEPPRLDAAQPAEAPPSPTGDAATPAPAPADGAGSDAPDPAEGTDAPVPTPDAGTSPRGANAGTSPSSAGTPLSADEVLRRAAEAHPDLRQARLRLRRARTLARAETSLLTPVASADLNVIHNEDPVDDLFLQGKRVTDIWRVGTQLAKRFDWGMDLTLRFEATRFESEQPFVLPGGVRDVNRIGPNWQESLTLTLRQPLMRGFGTQLGRLSLTAAEQQADAAALGLSQAASQAALEVLAAWHELRFATGAVEVRRRQLDIARAQREATEALIEGGSLAEIELDVVDQRMALLEESLLVAENDLLGRRAELGRLLGDPEGQRRDYVPEGDPATGAGPQDVEGLVAMAAEGNPELVTLRQQLAAQRVAMIGSRDAVKPQLDLTASLGQNALSSDGFFDAFGQIIELEATAFSAGVILSIPLDNGRAKERLEADRIELERIQAQVSALERQLGDQVREAHRLVALGARRVALTDRGVELARRTLEAEQARFLAGRSTNQQVLQVQEQLQQAEERALRARIDRELAVLRLRHLTGTLLAAFGAEIEP